MMFKIDQEPKFWQPVIVALPGEPEQSFRARFRVIPVSVYSKIDKSDAEAVQKMLDDTICDIADIEDADGKPLIYSHQTIQRLIDLPHLRGALILAYVKGISEAARGN